VRVLQQQHGRRIVLGVGEPVFSSPLTSMWDAHAWRECVRVCVANLAVQMQTQTPHQG
jgi:hypothetical protein